jgi:hypothetical protein
VLFFSGQYDDDLAQARNILSSTVGSDDRLRQLEELYYRSCAEEPVVKEGSRLMVPWELRPAEAQ